MSEQSADMWRGWERVARDQLNQAHVTNAALTRRLTLVRRAAYRYADLQVQATEQRLNTAWARALEQEHSSAARAWQVAEQESARAARLADALRAQSDGKAQRRLARWPRVARRYARMVEQGSIAYLLEQRERERAARAQQHGHSAPDMTVRVSGVADSTTTYPDSATFLASLEEHSRGPCCDCAHTAEEHDELGHCCTRQAQSTEPRLLHKWDRAAAYRNEVLCGTAGTGAQIAYRWRHVTCPDCLARRERTEAEQEAAQRYRTMTGMDLPLEQRAAQARRRADSTPMREPLLHKLDDTIVDLGIDMSEADSSDHTVHLWVRGYPAGTTACGATNARSSTTQRPDVTCRACQAANAGVVHLWVQGANTTACGDRTLPYAASNRATDVTCPACQDVSVSVSGDDSVSTTDEHDVSSEQGGRGAR